MAAPTCFSSSRPTRDKIKIWSGTTSNAATSLQGIAAERQRHGYELATAIYLAAAICLSRNARPAVFLATTTNCLPAHVRRKVYAAPKARFRRSLGYSANCDVAAESVSDGATRRVSRGPYRSAFQNVLARIRRVAVIANVASRDKAKRQKVLSDATEVPQGADFGVVKRKGGVRYRNSGLLPARAASREENGRRS